ncbi:hypothetical protein KM043_013656 [Ampulex compressa]|nr:hypothetical protein KM043_013656 [Ampulex compressa]
MIDLTVKTLDSQNHVFSLEDDQITVRGFKEHIAESVAVPADSQRLIYCGRVLQDEKKLNDYDVNGKVIHLVQRAPPQPGQRGNDEGQGQSYGHGLPHRQRAHYRLTRTPMQGNAMYLGALAVPAEITEGRGVFMPHLNNAACNNRLTTAMRVLNQANELMNRLEDPNYPVNPTTSESNQSPMPAQMHVQELETESEDNNENRFAQATAAVLAAALSAASANNVTLLRGNNEESTETRSTTEAQDNNQSDSQQSQHEQQGSTSNTDAQSNRRQSIQLPRPQQMAALLERVLDIHDRLRSYIERYRVLMQTDPALPVRPGPEGVEENQRTVDGVSEILHCMSHACHALSDIIVDMGQQPPRSLRCRPMFMQHSAVLQPSVPFQVEAHISLHGQNTNSNSGEENTGTNNATSQPEGTESTGANANQQSDSENNTQPLPGQQRQARQDQTQTPFGTVFNLSNNVEVLMAVSAESNMDSALGNEQSQNGEANNNNNAGRISATGVFPFGSTPAPSFIRNLMQAVANHVVQGNITTATITQNPPVTVAGQQTSAATVDSGSTNPGQSTQARSNVGTHPTTATQTRSTSRPHVFHQQAQVFNVGAGMGTMEFDPLLPCISHHLRRTPTVMPNATAAPSQTMQHSPIPPTEAQGHPQAGTTSTASNDANTSNRTPPTTSQTNPENSLESLIQQVLGAANGRPQATFNINSNAPLITENLQNIMQMLSGGNIHVGIVGNRGASATGVSFTLADLLESEGLAGSPFGMQHVEGDANMLLNLLIFVANNITLEGLMQFHIGQPEPIAQLRRPLLSFFQRCFPNASSEECQEIATERLLTQLRPYLQNFFSAEEEINVRDGARINICATIESLLSNHIRRILSILYNEDIAAATFGQEILDILNSLGGQLCAVLRYSIRGGQTGLEAIASRVMTDMLNSTHPAFLQWMLNVYIDRFFAYFTHVPQPPDSEIVPLLIYQNTNSQPAPVVSSAPTTQSPQVQPEHEPMETEVVEEKTNYETLLQEEDEDIPESFPGHEALPSDWVPIIARDGVRQRRQLQVQGMANGGVTTFSDAYLGGLPTKRRKLIEQQKSRLLVSPTPNDSTLTAFVERLVRESAGRAGVEEVEGAAVAVAADPGVRRAFGQAIRDCVYPRRYGFPDPLRFPNASKYFSYQKKPPEL